MAPHDNRSLVIDAVPSTPWTELDEKGANLTVDAFLTTLMSQVGNALRRTLTVPYAEQFGLTVSEWRVLSLVAHAGRIAFGELVIQSTSDKALVSRTLRLLESRDLVRLEPEHDKPRTKLWCAITPRGELLHSEVIPLARARQAAAIRALPPEERDAMYRALVRLREYCSQDEKRPAPDSDPDGSSL